MSSSSPSEPSTTSTTQGAYPLTTNNLSHLVSYTTRPSGTALVSNISLPAGALLTPITTATPVPAPLYSSVQTARGAHMELNSALLYLNHSCAPSLELDTQKMQIRVARDRDLAAGDDLTFFYPSTEWRFDRPFRCLCGAGQGVCVGHLEGAVAIASADLRTKWFVNPHILELAAERDAEVVVAAPAAA